MINIDGMLINPSFVVSAEVETRHYMNGSASWLIVRMADGSQIRREHGFGFDAFKVRYALAEGTASQDSSASNERPKGT